MRRLCGSVSILQPRAAACASAASASGRSSAALQGRSRQTSAAQRADDARAHLGGRLAREGDREDLARVLDRAQELQEAPRQHGRLAGARRSLQQDRGGRCARLERARHHRGRIAGESLIGFIRVGRGLGAQVRADAADIRDVAVVAGAGCRVDPRIACEKGADESLDERLPAALLRAPVGGRTAPRRAAPSPSAADRPRPPRR